MKCVLSRSLLLGAILAATTTPAFAQRRRLAQRAAARAESVTTVEGISEYRLPNGLRIILVPDASRPSTTVSIAYLVGSRHEGYGESGMAHLLEHLLFKGTPTHPDIPQQLAERGGRANASTSVDRTNYFITFPDSQELEWALRLEADRMVNSFLRPEDLASEMTVVRNELELGETTPLSVTIDRTLATAYLWHAYGRSPIGARSDIEGVPNERLRAFYRKYYQPDNAVLVVSGRLDVGRALRWIERYFGALPRPGRTGDMRIWNTYTREPPQDGERSVTVRRVGDAQHVVAVYHVPAGASPDFASVDLLAHVLANAPSGRLYRALVDTRQASAVTAQPILLREPGTLIVTADVPRNASLDSARVTLLRVLDGLAGDPPTEAELERARTARLRDFQLALHNSERVGLVLTEWTAAGDWRLMFLHRDRLRRATLADVAAAARAYLRPSNRTVGQFLPEAEPRPVVVAEAPNIDTMVAGYRGRDTIAAGATFEPTPANVESRLRRVELPNGFRLALLPRRTRGGSVLALFSQRLSLPDDSARLAEVMLMAPMLTRGTTSMTRQQLTDSLARLGAVVLVDAFPDFPLSGTIRTSRTQLISVLRLFGEMLREPAFVAPEFEALQRERLAMFEGVRSQPMMAAIAALARHQGPRRGGDEPPEPTIDEMIALIRAGTLDSVRALYRETFGFGAGGSFTVVGDFDPDDVEAVARAMFGDRPPRRPYARRAHPFEDVPDTTIIVDTPGQPSGFFLATLLFPMRDDDPDYPALRLAVYLLGGGFMNSRLMTRIRQSDGLSYGILADMGVGAVDSSAMFMAMAPHAPQNGDRLIAAFRQEVERALRDGYTAEEVEAGKRAWTQERDVARATDEGLARLIHGGLVLGRTLMWHADLEARVRALTADQVNQAFRRHFRVDRITIVDAADRTTPAPMPRTP